MSFLGLLIHSVEIFRHEYNAGTGQVSVIYITNGAVPARIEPIPTRDREEHTVGRFPQGSHKMFIDRGVEIKHGYRVKRLDTGQVWEVVNVSDFDNSLRVHHKEVFMEEKEVVNET